MRRIVTSSYSCSLFLRKITLFSLIFFLTACSIVPKREFSNYTHIFEQVQAIGEEVIIDYAAAKKEQAWLKHQEEVQAARKDVFNSNQLLISTVAVDDIAIRLKAWRVLGSYNKILTKLIAGEPVEAETKNLFNELLNLSISGLRDAAAKLSPFASALDAIFVEVQKGFKRRKIVQSIEKVSPIISSQLIVNMKKDSELFYKVRYAINSHRYQQLRVDISRHIATFIKLANLMDSHTQNYKVYPLVNTLNRRLEQIASSSTGRGFKPIRLNLKAGKTNSILTVSQLQLLKTQILILLAQAEQKNRALEAYSEMLTAYVRLLSQMDLSLRIMQHATKINETESIKLGEDFEISLIKMRQALSYYQKTYP
jgi:hypothetical protein